MMLSTKAFVAAGVPAASAAVAAKATVATVGVIGAGGSLWSQYPGEKDDYHMMSEYSILGSRP